MYLASIPPSFVPTPRRGMGAIDFSTFSTEDWILIGVMGMGLIAFANPGASIFQPSKKRRRRGGKRKSGGLLGFGGGAVTALILAGGGYLAYQLATSGSSGGAG